MKHSSKSLIPQYNPAKIETPKLYINKDSVLMNGWNIEGNEANVFLSIRFIQHQEECLSEWDKNEIKGFWSFVESIHQQTWKQVYNGSRKDKKSGLGYTEIPLKKYPKSDFKDSIDPNCTFFELRISEKARVHCFRDKSICYVCWLDKSHKFFP